MVSSFRTAGLGLRMFWTLGGSRWNPASKASPQTPTRLATLAERSGSPEWRVIVLQSIQSRRSRILHKKTFFAVQWAQCMASGQRERASRCIKPAVMASADLIGGGYHSGLPPQNLHRKDADRGAASKSKFGHTHSLHQIKSHLLFPARWPVTTAAAALQGTNHHAAQRGQLASREPEKINSVAPPDCAHRDRRGRHYGNNGFQRLAQADHSHLGCLE